MLNPIGLPGRGACIAVLAFSLLFSASPPVIAGPNDLKTNYHVGMDVGIAFPGTTGGIYDTGGTTSLSFVDAQLAGLLGPNGLPLTPPSGTSTVGGTGGAAVRVNYFDNVDIDVTPLDANGVSNGPARRIRVRVVVPMRPADQTGTPAEQQRKTQSLGNKIGKNAAAELQLKLIDTPTADPNKNSRATEWANASPGDPIVPPPLWQIPFDPVLVGPGGAPVVHGVQVNATPGLDADFISASTSVVPAFIAPTLGITPIGFVDLPRDTNSALFADGYFDSPPDDIGAGTITLPYGLMTVTFSTLGGGTLSVGQVATVISPDATRLVVGANAIMPEDHVGWFTSTAYNIRPIPEASFTALAAASLTALAARRTRRPARASL